MWHAICIPPLARLLDKLVAPRPKYFVAKLRSITDKKLNRKISLHKKKMR